MPYASAVIAIALALALPLAAFLVLMLSRPRGPDIVDQRRRAAGVWIPRLSVIATIATYLCVTLILVEAWKLHRVEPEPEWISALSGVLRGVDMAVMLWAALGAYLLIPGVVGVLMAAGTAARWRNPARILVLRRFARDDTSRALKALIGERVSRHGHVYTLADRDINTPWYVRLPVVLTQLVFLHFRASRVRNEHALDTLMQDVEIRWARNVNWLVSWSKTFPVYCTDDMWRRCVAALSARADATIIDVSILSDNLTWEIENCIHRGLVPRLILIADANSEATARESLDRFPASDLEDRLVIHDRAPTRMDELLRGAIARARADGSTDTRSVQIRRRLSALAGMVSVIGAAAIVVFAAIAYHFTSDYFSDEEIAGRRIAQLFVPSQSQAALEQLIQLAERSPDEAIWFSDLAQALKRLWDKAPQRRGMIADLMVSMREAPSDELWLRALRDLPDTEHARKRRILAQWTAADTFADAKVFQLLEQRLARRTTDEPPNPAVRVVDRLLMEAIDDRFVLWKVAGIAACAPDAQVRADAHAHIDAIHGPRDKIIDGLRECTVRRLADPATAGVALTRLLHAAQSGKLNGHAIDVDELADSSLRRAFDELWASQPALRTRIVDLSLQFGDRWYDALWLRALRELPDAELDRKRAMIQRWSHIDFRHLGALSEFLDERSRRWASGVARSDESLQLDHLLVLAIANPGETWKLEKRMAVLQTIAAMDGDARIRAAAMHGLASLSRQ